MKCLRTKSPLPAQCLHCYWGYGRGDGGCYHVEKTLAFGKKASNFHSCTGYKESGFDRPPPPPPQRNKTWLKTSVVPPARSLIPSARTSLIHSCPQKGMPTWYFYAKGVKGCPCASGYCGCKCPCLGLTTLQPNSISQLIVPHFLVIENPWKLDTDLQGSLQAGTLLPHQHAVCCALYCHTPCLQCFHFTLCLISLPTPGSSSNLTSSVKPQEILLTLFVHKLEQHWLSFQIISPRGL